MICLKNTAYRDPVPVPKTDLPAHPAGSDESTQTDDNDAGSSNSSGSATTPSSGSIDNLSFEEQVAALVNEQRAANGLSPLTLNEKLSDAARAKSQDMHDNNYLLTYQPTYGSPLICLQPSVSATGQRAKISRWATPRRRRSWMPG